MPLMRRRKHSSGELSKLSTPRAIGQTMNLAITSIIALRITCSSCQWSCGTRGKL